jgi:hypothetical protein
VWSGATIEGAVSHYLGVLAMFLGRAADAERHLVDALERHGRMEAPFLVAWTLAALARLLESTDPARAASARQRAYDIADARGFGAIRA